MFEEKGKPDAKASTHRALLSLSARVPLRRGHPVGGRWRERACTVPAISPIARSSDWIDGGRKFESHNPRRGLGAPASVRLGLFGLGRLSILVRPSPTSSMQVFSSETQVVGEGEYKTDTDRLRETGSECCTLACQTIETFGETRRRACRLMQTCENDPNASAGIWLKAKLLDTTVAPLLALSPGSQRFST